VLVVWIETVGALMSNAADGLLVRELPAMPNVGANMLTKNVVCQSCGSRKWWEGKQYPHGVWACPVCERHLMGQTTDVLSAGYNYATPLSQPVERVRSATIDGERLEDEKRTIPHVYAIIAASVVYALAGVLFAVALIVFGPW
jgi:ribosomal protein L37AE/L43A